jgi:hypothetical protein
VHRASSADPHDRLPVPTVLKHPTFQAADLTPLRGLSLVMLNNSR